MNWIYDIDKLDLSENKYSQYGEEVIIQYILYNIGVNDKGFFVDIGAGGAGKGLSNTKLLTELGWEGLSFDIDESEGIIKEFIKPDNVLEVLAKYNCPTLFEFLNIDVDSFDYDILKEILTEYEPLVICTEFNGTLDPLSNVKLKYEDGYTWDGTNKYGFSFTAGVKLLNDNGYTVVYNSKDTNLIAVNNKLLGNILQEILSIKATQNIYHPINEEAEWEELQN